MPFQVSPGVNISEIDLTAVVPAVSTTEGALAGVFRWGPVGQRVLVSSETELMLRFGRPTNINPETFFTAADFLAYGNKLYVVRAANTTATDANASFNAIANSGSYAGGLETFNVGNDEDYEASQANFSSGANVKYIARYPGDIGNSLKISVCDSAEAYESNVNLTDYGNTFIANTSATFMAVTVGGNTAAITIANSATGNSTHTAAVAAAVAANLTIGDTVLFGNNTIGTTRLRITEISSVTTNNTTGLSTLQLNFAEKYSLSTNFTYTGVSNTTGTFVRAWEYRDVVDSAPLQSEYFGQLPGVNTAVTDTMHVIVVDENGSFTGVPGTILEVYRNVSRATDAKLRDGTNNYYADVINNGSSYVWFTNDRSGAVSNTAVSLTNSSNRTPMSLSFHSGTDAFTEENVPLALLTGGYDKFASAEDVDISLVMQGKALGGTNGEQLGNYIIDNIVESRRDCIAFLSPASDDVVGVTSAGTALDNVLAFRNSVRSSSYAVMDSGYKYRYDKYNDLYRWTPLNGDMAGLCVRTDEARDAWWSPAGFNRGIVKNIVKLAFNPDKARRDQLYKAGVNPVVTFPGQGTILFGDKTLLKQPSAFDRINVRRLFIVLEKAIATAAKFTLFEFNDDFTRAQFRNIVEPFLRDIQGRRGIYDFKVICDSTNNTGEVIDRNEFIGDIYVKPARSINFIQLNFVAVRSGVEFTEVVGNF